MTDNQLLNIPAELRDRAQWVAARIYPDPKQRGKTQKVLVNPHTGQNASSTDPATWGTFTEACECQRRCNLQGIGYVFAPDDPYCGIDFDHVIDADGNTEQWALDYVRRLDSYTERSQSKTGLHIITRATLPPTGRKKGPVEMYTDGRFFVFTGDVLAGYTVIRDAQEAVNLLHRETFGEAQPAPLAVARTAQPPVTLADAELLAKLRACKGGKYAALWDGNLAGYPSQSEADLALCHGLAFYAGGDAGTVDRLFRDSALYREKWDKAHFRSGATYGENTIGLALAGMTDFYNGNGHEPAERRAVPEEPEWMTATDPPALDDDALAAQLDAQPQDKAQADKHVRATLEVLSIRDLMTREWPEPVWAVPGVLPVGLTVIAGRPKIGKSWLCLQLTQAVATGGDFLGVKVARGRVLYFALEDPPRRLAERAKSQGWDDLAAEADFITVGHYRRGDGRQLADIIRTGGYRLVIVDTLARAFTADKDSGDDMTAALTPVQEAAHAGNCAVVLVHHHNKVGAATSGTGGATEPDPLVNLQGSISIGGMADCIIGMYRQKDKAGVLLCGYGRDVEEYALNLTFDRTTHCWQAVNAGGPKVTDERARVIMALQDLGPSTATELNKVLETDRGNLHKRLQNMVSLGLLDRDASGRYSVPEL